MIIACPSCATRYDVDEARFKPDGRTVRCAECNESWFVPAPQPVEDLMPLKAADRARDDQRSAAAEGDRGRDPEAFSRPRGGFDAEPIEDALFSAASDARKTRYHMDDGDERAPRNRPEPSRRGHDGDRVDPRRPWVKSSEDRGADRFAEDVDFRPDFKANDKPDRAPDRSGDFRADLKPPRDDRGRERVEERSGPADAPRARRADPIVDADFEDIDRGSWRDPRFDDRHDDRDDFAAERGFGRKIREERRRATALARIDDLDPIAERVFNEEFFAALRVQPKELERAIRKARRRAESREKNRLTPLRALGWSAWIGAIGATLFVGYAYRDKIVAFFPNAASAYRAVGLEANPFGLKIEGVTHRLAASSSGPAIEILGRIANEGEADQPAPMLLAEALGAKGEVLASWTFAASAARVQPGGSIDFVTRAPAPVGVAEVALSFAPAEGVKVSVGELPETPAAE